MIYVLLRTYCYVAHKETFVPKFMLLSTLLSVRATCGEVSGVGGEQTCIDERLVNLIVSLPDLQETSSLNHPLTYSQATRAPKHKWENSYFLGTYFGQSFLHLI